MKRLVPILLTLLLLGTPSAAQDTVLRCGAIFDGDAMTAGSDIVVRDGRIVTGPPDSGEVINLSAYTCLPGLIDLHAHLTINPETLTALDMTRSSAARALDALANAQKMLNAGFTTLRTPGEFDGFYGTVDLKNAINRGQHAGPRLLVAPHAISATGGHGDFNNLMADLHIETPTRIADGPDQLRLEIRREFKYGADWIKLMMTGGVMSAGDDPNVSTYTLEEEVTRGGRGSRTATRRRSPSTPTARPGSSPRSAPGWTRSSTRPSWTRRASGSSRSAASRWSPPSTS